MSRIKVVALVVVVAAIAVGISAIWWGRGGGGGGQSPVSVRISPLSQEAAPGDTVVVTIDVTPAKIGVSGGRVHLGYNASALEVASIDPGYLFGPTPLCGFKEVDEDAGVVGYALARVGDTAVPSDAGVFATVTFIVVESAATGDCDLTLKYVSFCDDDFEDIKDVEVEHGSITVKG